MEQYFSIRNFSISIFSIRKSHEKFEDFLICLLANILRFMRNLQILLANKIT